MNYNDTVSTLNPFQRPFIFKSINNGGLDVIRVGYSTTMKQKSGDKDCFGQKY